MANVTKTGTPTVCTPTPGYEHRVTGLLAGEAIAGGDACYIKASDGLVYKADSSANDEGAVVAGYAATAASSGEAVTLVWNVMFAYGANISGTLKGPGTLLYLSADTAGALADATSSHAPNPIGQVVDAAGRAFLWRNFAANA